MGTARILVVEDEPVLARDLEKRLQRCGHEVVGRVGSGEAAIDAAANTRPDLVLMDIKLAGKLDGIEAATEIQSRLDTAIVYLTVLSERDAFERAKSTRPYGYLTKPVAPEELERAVEMALYKHRTDRKLLEHERRLELALEAAKGGTFHYDVESDTSTWDDRSLRIFGVSADQFAGTFQAWADLVHPEDLPRTDRKVREFMNSGTESALDIEFRIIRPDGEIRYVHAPGFLIRDATGNPRTMTGLFFDVTDRTRAEEQLKASLREKDVLMREIFHRVKNNFQVILSLLMLQSDLIDDEKYLRMFEDTQGRIHAMALVHERLYESENLADINIEDYIIGIVEHLLDVHLRKDARIALKTDIEGISLGIDTALSCGLLITELVSNSLKHAFPHNQSGEIGLRLRSIGEDRYELVIRDNGVGMPSQQDVQTSDSLGLRLVAAFVRNLNGTLEVNVSGGTFTKIEFKGR